MGDVAPLSFSIDLKDLANKLSKKTKAIISVPMWGYPSYYKELSKLAESYHIPIIEDAAQAIGTLNHDQYEGTHGSLGCFSTHERKMISTGEGGFILTNNDLWAEKCKTFSKIGLHAKTGYFGYQVGINYKINALAAALGRVQIRKLHQRLKSNTHVAMLWKKYLPSDLFREISYTDKGTPNYYALLVTINRSLPYNQKLSGSLLLAKELAKQGIFTDIHRYNYQLLPAYPIFQHGSAHQHLPNAKQLLTKLITLPTHEGITEKTLQKAIPIIIKTIKKLF